MPPSFFIRDRLSSLQEADKQVPVRSKLQVLGAQLLSRPPLEYLIVFTISLTSSGVSLISSSFLCIICPLKCL
jgi:hypothetical protein